MTIGVDWGENGEGIPLSAGNRQAGFAAVIAGVHRPSVTTTLMSGEK
jgi:hypothetical protein